VSIAYENNLKVFWLDAATGFDQDEVLVSELEAGTHLTPYIPVSGVDRPSQQNQASLAMLDDAFISEATGTWSVGPINLTFVRDPGNEDSGHPWNLFEYGKSGFLFVVPDGDEVFDAEGDIEAGGEGTLYRVQAHEPTEMPSAENTIQQFTVSFPVQGLKRRTDVVATLSS
jgi:hypothetical protein